MDPDVPQATPADGDAPTPEPTDEGTLSSVQRRLEGKPVLIYGTLIAGAVVLLLLLMVVWLSTRNSGSPVNLCLDTNVAEAQAAILEGGVRRADVLIDAEQPMQGLTAIQLELEDGECRKLPEGADNRGQLLQVLGLIELYNQEGDGNVRVEYQREEVPANLLAHLHPHPDDHSHRGSLAVGWHPAPRAWFLTNSNGIAVTHGRSVAHPNATPNGAPNHRPNQTPHHRPDFDSLKRVCKAHFRTCTTPTVRDVAVMRGM